MNKASFVDFRFLSQDDLTQGFLYIEADKILKEGVKIMDVLRLIPADTIKG